ncbi:MAG: sulfatase-like hydrolase/transferase [Planctomycetes bacterium]|nr:sulfatase-like hydrolase/transferase [Planctomycetota bacterium]
MRILKILPAILAFDPLLDLLLAAAAAPGGEEPARKPNVLLIHCDQLRYDALAANSRNRYLRTPNLDRLAREGVSFTRAYAVSPVCVPARYSLLSGRWPLRTGITDNGRGRYPEDGPSLMRTLAANGYQTTAAGKMHFTPVRARYGFQQMFLSEEIPARLEDDDFLRELQGTSFAHVEEPHGCRSWMYYLPQVSQLPKELHTTAWTAQKTIETIRGRKTGDPPFFIWTSFIKPHPPFDPPVPYNSLYLPEQMDNPIRGSFNPDDLNTIQLLQAHYKQMSTLHDLNFNRILRAAYHACVAFIDDEVGRILAALEASGELENTIIILTADHGEFLGDHWCYGKRSWHEGPGHIPMVIRLPGKKRAGETRPQIVTQTDLFPTLVELCGLQTGQELDGLSMARWIDRPEEPGRECFFGQFSEGKNGVYLAMNREWKYIFSAPDGIEQLLRYDTPEAELVNRARNPAFQEVKRRLKEKLIEFFKKENYLLPLNEMGDLKVYGGELRKELLDLLAHPERPYQPHRINQFPAFNGRNAEVQKKIDEARERSKP